MWIEEITKTLFLDKKCRVRGQLSLKDAQLSQLLSKNNNNLASLAFSFIMALNR